MPRSFRSSLSRLPALLYSRPRLPLCTDACVLPFWSYHSGPTILVLPFWSYHSCPTILVLPFWSYHFGPTILVLSFGSRESGAHACGRCQRMTTVYRRDHCAHVARFGTRFIASSGFGCCMLYVDSLLRNRYVHMGPPQLRAIAAC